MPDAAVRCRVLEHEEIDAFAPVAASSGEGALRASDALLQEGLIVGQVHRVEDASQSDQFREVPALDGPQDQHGRSRSSATRRRAFSSMVKPASSSSSVTFSGSSMRTLWGAVPAPKTSKPSSKQERTTAFADLGAAVEGDEGLHGADARASPHRARKRARQHFEASLQPPFQHRDAPFGPQVSLALEPIDQTFGYGHADGGTGEGAGHEAGPRVVGLAEQHGAPLERLSARDHVHPFLQAERLEREELTRARERLHLVDPHSDTRVFAALHQRRKERRRRRLDTAFAEHELEEHGRHTTLVAAQVRVERVEAVLRGVGVFWIVKRYVQRTAALRQASAIGGPVREFGQAGGASREATLEQHDAVGRAVLLQHHLERVLVGYRAGDGEPDVLQARTGVSQERARELEVLRARVEVTLEDRVGSGRSHRRLQQVAIGVAEGEYADTADEVELDRAVGELNPCASAATSE